MSEDDAALAALEAELRQMLGRTYELPAEKLEALEPSAQLYGGALELDSLDAMAFVIAIEDRFGVTVQNDAAARKAFASLRSLAQHVASLLQNRPAV